MDITFSERGKFIPKWHGNRDADADEQFYLEYDYLSWTQRSRYLKKKNPKLTVEDLDQKSDEQLDKEILAQHSKFEVEISTNDDGIVKAMKPVIRNFTANGKAIDTWDKLIELPQTPENDLAKLVAECTAELSNVSAKEQDSKNSE